MNRRYIYSSLLLLSLAIACAEPSSPTTDESNVLDADVQLMDMFGTTPDSMMSDMALPIDQEFIPSAEPIPNRVETVISSREISAGQTAQISCSVFSTDDEPLDEINTAVDVRPLDGATLTNEDGMWKITAERAGVYSVACTAPSIGLRDFEGETLTVVPGNIAWTSVRVEPEVILAGEETTVRCILTDKFGNAIPESEESQVVVSPGSTNHSRMGNTFSTTLAGEFSFRCIAGNAEVTSAVLVVQPDVPANLVVSPSPAKPSYRLGEVLGINYTVTDRFDNPLFNYPVSIESRPMLQTFGPRRFRLTEEGPFRIILTLDDTEPLISAELDILVDERGPRLDCNTPTFGEIMILPEDRQVPIRGFVKDLSGVERASLTRMTSAGLETIDLTLDTENRFEETIIATPGLNILELVATDELNKTARSICGFFAVPSYEIADDVVNNTIALDLRQDAVDDGDNGLVINSFGDLARAVVRSTALETQVDAAFSTSPTLVGRQSYPLGNEITHIKYNGDVAFNSPNLALTLQPNGLGVSASIEKVKFDLKIKGRILGISCNTTGPVKLKNIVASSTFEGNMVNELVELSSSDTLVEVTDIDTNFAGGCGNFIDFVLTVIDIFSDLIPNTVAGVIKTLIDDTLTGLLSDAINGIDFSGFAFEFELAGLDGQISNLALSTALTDADIDAQRFRLGLGTKIDGPRNNALPNLGVPRFGPPADGDYESSGNMSAVLDAMLLNQVMYGLWRANFFDLSDIGALSDSGTSNLEASLTLLAPPAIEILDGQEEFRLHFGPAVGTLAYGDLLSEPLELRFAAILRAGIELRGDGTVNFAPDGLTMEILKLDAADSGLPAESSEALELEIGNLVRRLLDDAVSGALPSLPIPEFALPASVSEFGLSPNLSLGIRDPSLDFAPESIIINGDFRQ